MGPRTFGDRTRWQFLTVPRAPSTDPAPDPLDGIRVVDLTTVMFGPCCTQIPGAMGADVVKVEPPSGDIGRQTGATRSPGMSAAHLMNGRNKRSIVFDLEQRPGIEVLARLTSGADVFVHNMRPQAAARLGLDYERVRRTRADVVYAHATGFGVDGLYAERPAYDNLIQGMSGMVGLYRTFRRLRSHIAVFFPHQGAGHFESMQAF